MCDHERAGVGDDRHGPRLAHRAHGPPQRTGLTVAQALRLLARTDDGGRPALLDRPRTSQEVALADARPARHPRLWVTLDLVLVVACASLGLVAARGLGLDAPGPALVAATSALAALAAVGVDLVLHGRSPGHRLLRTRSVEPTTGLPGPLASLPRAAAVDLRRGRDPVRLQPLAHAPVPAQSWRAGAQATPATVVVTLDDGTSATVAAVTVIGRNPVRREGAPEVLQVPDLSRTMSKSHAVLEPDAPRLWVTDLGSTNGTALLAAGHRRSLAPGVRTAVGTGEVLELGDRLLTLGGRASSRAGATEVQEV